jgi:hypothetical protein
VNKIALQTYSADESRWVPTGEEVSIPQFVRGMSIEDMADLLDCWVNLGDERIRGGRELGKQLTTHHRWLQTCIIDMCIGVLHELGQQEYTDARNKRHVETARRVSEFLQENMGYFFGE